MPTTQATATRDPFAGLTAYADESDAMAESFGIVTATPVAAKPAPVVRCLGGCGRQLTSAASLARGYGKHCWKKAHERVATLGPEFSDRQVEDAIELVEDGGVVPAAVAGLWFTISRDGLRYYATTIATCECERFTAHGKTCFHRAAVALVAA